MISFHRKADSTAVRSHSNLAEEHKFINTPLKQNPLQSKPPMSFSRAFDLKPDVFRPRPVLLEVKESDAINGFVDVADWTKIKAIKL